MSKGRPKAIVLTDCIATGLLLRDEAKKRGLKVIGYQSKPIKLLQDLPSSYRPPYVEDAEFYDEIVWEKDLDVGASKLKSLDYDIVAVIPGHEMGVISGDTLANKLGLRSNDPRLTLARRNKIEMKKAVESAGLRVAKHRSCRSKSELEDFVEEAPFPIVLKPPTGVGMYRFSICHDLKEAQEGFDKIMHQDDSLGSVSDHVNAEEYIDGVEYAVDTFSDGKDVFATDIWRYRRIDIPPNRNLYYDIFMEPLDDPELESLREYAVNICKALGIKYGAAHPEIMIDGKGPVMMEVNARFAGCRMPQMCRDLSNFDPIASTLDVYCGKEPTSKRPIRYKKLAWIAFCPNKERGEITGFDGLDKIQKLSSYESHFLTYQIGEHISPTVDLWNNPLTVWLVNADGDRLRKDAELVHKYFCVKTK